MAIENEANGSNAALLSGILVGATVLMSITAFIVATDNIVIEVLARIAVWIGAPQKMATGLVGAVLSSVIIVGCAIGVAASKLLQRDERAHDLMYYLGFIGTLIGLCGASLLLASGVAASAQFMPLLVAQNGVALITTLAGLMCRNLLRYAYAPRPPDLKQMVADAKAAAAEARNAVAEVTTVTNQYAQAVGILSQTLGAARSTIEASQSTWNGVSDSIQGVTSGLSSARAASNDLAGSIGGIRTSIGQIAAGVQAAARDVERMRQAEAIAEPSANAGPYQQAPASLQRPDTVWAGSPEALPRPFPRQPVSRPINPRAAPRPSQDDGLRRYMPWNWWARS